MRQFVLSVVAKPGVHRREAGWGTTKFENAKSPLKFMPQTTAIPSTPLHSHHALNQNAEQYTGLDRSHPSLRAACSEDRGDANNLGKRDFNEFSATERRSHTTVRGGGLQSAEKPSGLNSD